MQSKIKTTIFGCSLLALLASGCAHTGELQVWRPAELEIQGVSRLAVLDFEGQENQGKIANAAITAQLSGDGFFQLVDQSELDRVAPVSPRHGVGSPNVTAAIDAARKLGVDAILTGQVVSYTVDDQITSHHALSFFSDEESDGHERESSLDVDFESSDTIHREGTVTLAFRIIDARSGQTVAARQTSHSFSAESEGGVSLPPKDSVLAQLTRECVVDISTSIAPHTETVEVDLAYGGRGISRRTLEQGNQLAKKGDWDAAAKLWRESLEQDSKNHAALFNLASFHQSRHEYESAHERAVQAHRAKGKKKYMAGIEQIVENAGNYDLAMSQSRNRTNVTHVSHRQDQSARPNGGPTLIR